jgi:SpoVK/Ycf46/Vps4 family AAA+-type ATPase
MSLTLLSGTKLTSCSGVRGLQGEGESSFFRTIVVETESTEATTLDGVIAAARTESATSDVSTNEEAKFRNINLSHIREMLRSLDPAAAANIADAEEGPHLLDRWATIFPISYSQRVLTYDEVHRIALTALGLHVTSPASRTEGAEATTTQISWAHVILAMGLIRASDTVKFNYFDSLAELAKKTTTLEEQVKNLRPGEKLRVKKKQDTKSLQRQQELQQISKTATKHEQWLMPGIADADQIKTTFDQVHVPPETIESIRTITSLSMLRPDAFSYGILATEKISGALLYGPPGTGKTLLAKAVAKESGSTVLEVSGAQIMGKYVGESEKNVAALFSLAQKLSPCIVFLDEADSIFGSRDALADRTGSHRQTLNQFLKEWDGLNSSNVFVMVATNRPFDLDDAVIRRLPRRLLVDLPTQADRKAILRIHLEGEQLDESVDLDDLAKRTPFYSGSDLKNVVVSAALACVKEENEQAALAAAKTSLELETPIQPEADATGDASTSSALPTPSNDSSSAPSQPPKILHLVRGQTYNFPEKRTLQRHHFDKALQEISASISEDMSSLNRIKKFDEQYGDRKGKKRRKDFGFGVAPERNENAARVRL